MFIFAGVDSTASTIAYTFHMLAKHAEVLGELRDEHDRIFGKNADAGTHLREQPALLNSHRYTQAVIKQTMRLYSVSSSLRDSLPDVSVIDKNENVSPTEGLNVMLMYSYIHTNSRVLATSARLFAGTLSRCCRP